MVVPFPPGGTSDSVARLLAKGMGDRLGQPVIVENKGGGGTIIGTDSVARSAPDGYTLLWMTPPFAINHTLYKKLPYKTLEDITVVADIVEVPLVLIVRNDSKLQSIADIVDVSRKEPGKLTYASSGIGGTPHLATSMFASAKNIAFTHVPYQGSSPAVMAMLGGQTDMVFDTLFLTYPQVTAGKARALAQTGAQRSELLPDVPTMAEAGLPGYQATSWMSLGAPSGIPASILRRLSEAARDTVASTSFSQPLVQQGVVMVKRSQADAQARVSQEVAKWGEIVHQSGATAQ
jgi:tripartite-type tricarboxylate transporter receptor subunit TctC